MANNERAPRLLIVVFGLSLVLGTFLRVVDIGHKSISHPEMYTPGIRMPAELSHPHERLTLAQVLTGTFSSDTHPPAYYVVMLYWTRVFGASLTSLRLPSVCFGIASLLLLVWCGHLCGEKQAGWLAGSLLALSGPHAFWSQVARMYVFACFLGLLSTVLLLLLMRVKGRRALLATLYVLVTFTGVATHVYYWPLFLAQIGYIFLRAARESESLHGILKVQILAFILATLWLATSAYQSANGVAGLSAQPFVHLFSYLGFGYLIPNTSFLTRLDPNSKFVQLVEAYFFELSFLAFATAALLTYFALRRQKGETLPLAIWTRRPSWTSWICAAVITGTAIQAFVLIARAYARPAPNRTLIISQGFVVLPFLVSAAGFLLAKKWEFVSRWTSRVWRGEWTSDPRVFLGMMAFGPFVVLCVLSLVRPALVARGMTVYAPYVLLVMSVGLVPLMKQQRAIAALIIAALLGLHSVSLATHVPARIDPVEFGTFAKRLLPEIRPGDIVLIYKEYGTTPILFYLKEDACQCDLVEMQHAAAVLNNDKSKRVWLISFYESRPAGSLQRELQPYSNERAIEMADAHALLYVRHSAPRIPSK